MHYDDVGLEHVFHPRSIAIVGASAGPSNIYTQMFLDSLVEFGFRGRIYPINPKFTQISGIKAYPSILRVPGPVDYVISLISAIETPQLAKDCIIKGVRTMQLFTAGFAEMGTEVGRSLQEKVVSVARSGGIRIIGPNCVGIYYPAYGMSYCPDFPKEAGNVSFITQSGSYSYFLVRLAATRGVRFSKVVSYGNACDINEIDLLHYLAHDPDTEIICAHIEGTKDGRQLLKVLTKAVAEKPVIVIKRGNTKSGVRGASSHTGSMAGDDAVWATALRQAGAIRVEDVEEMVDLLVTFVFLRCPVGRRAVVVGTGGGVSVRAADECEAGGLNLSPITKRLGLKLQGVVSAPGTMLTNPIDLQPADLDAWRCVIGILDGREEVDMLLWQICPEVEPFRRGLFRLLTIEMKRLDLFKELRKPKAVIVHGAESQVGAETLNTLRTACCEQKIAFYPSVYRAALAISRCLEYYDWRARRAQS
jgi:acyl-CoA synthetase (NDP forming)